MISSPRAAEGSSSHSARSFGAKVRNSLFRKLARSRHSSSDDTLDSTKERSEIPISVGTKASPLAEERVVEILSKARFLQRRNQLFDIPSFSKDAFEVGPLVARGGFANVHMLATWNCACELTEEENHSSRYVIKSLRAESGRSLERLAMTAADLIMEAYFLSALNHPNIIQLRGMSNKGLLSLRRGQVDGLFLILDYLPLALYNRLQQWQDTQDSFTDRLLAVKQLASALRYMHKRNIVYRDLKPSNVGFTQNGTLQLFDFGMAVEVPPSSDPNRVFNLTGKKGTARYMAPEVIKKKAYNAKADVFSFAVLLWQVMALEKPYAKHNANEAILDRILSGERPPLKRLVAMLEGSLSPNIISNLRQLLQKGWSKRLEERPAMADFYAHLKGLVQHTAATSLERSHSDGSSRSECDEAVASK